MNSDIKKYINEIKKIIPINSKDKKDFLKMMEQRILESSNLENKCDYDNIVKEFGKPNEVAASYIEEIDTENISTKSALWNSKKWVGFAWRIRNYWRIKIIKNKICGENKNEKNFN